MDDPRNRRPLADDEAFLESLSDLDAGLGPGSEPQTAPARKNDPAKSASLPPSITAPFDALTVTDGAPASTAPHQTPAPARRPLLELFPSETAQPSAPRAHAPAAAPSRPPNRFRDVEPITASDDDAFYGLKEKPFGSSPDPRFFYHSTPHDAVVQQLLTAIRRREGLVVLTGADDLGKTTMCRVVLEQIDRRTMTSLLTERIDTPEQLLTQILSDFGVLSRTDQRETPAAELRKTLQSFVESLGSIDAGAVVIVDDAQRLPPAAFDEVRALCEAAHVSSRLQVILVGDDGLAGLLRRKDNRALHQRVAVRSAAHPLPAAEVADYVAHRLSVAGNARVEFDEDALTRLVELSAGVPGAINRICDRMLSHGRASSAGVMTEALVDAAARDLGLHGPKATAARLLARIVAALFVVAFLLVGAAVAAWVFRDAVARAMTNWERIPIAPDAPRRLPAPLPAPRVPDEAPSSGLTRPLSEFSAARARVVRIGLRVRLPGCRIAAMAGVRVPGADGSSSPDARFAAHDLTVEIRSPESDHQGDRDDQRYR